MVHSTTLRGAVCVAALFAGGSAHADVTAAEVWENIKTQMEGYGEQGLTIGAEEISGGTVAVSDIAISFSDDEISWVMDVGDMTLTEQGDGTVSVTMEESFPIVISGADGVVVTIDITQENLSLIVGGEPEAMNYTIAADSYGIAFREAVDGGVTFTGDASLTASGITGNYVVSGDELQEIVSDLSVETVDVLVDFQIPGGNGEYITGAAKINGLTSQGEATVPVGAEFENPDDIFIDGFGFSGGYQIGSAEYVFDMNVDGDQLAGSVSTGPVTLEGEMNIQTIAYQSTSRDIAISFVSGAFPLPIEMSVAEYGVNFRMPVGVSEEPAPFAIGFDMVDLEVSEMLWNIFDAGAVLPRDPATLQIGLSGTAKALIDLLDPANTEAFDSQEVPFEPYSLTLDTLRLSVAGALITGGGEFTFDNTDTQTFAPLPRPQGDALIEIIGLNGLLDNLVAMGLVPADQVMGPRMMMGMFARATGDDMMEIAVEVTEDGQVNVNGNRVR